MSYLVPGPGMTSAHYIFRLDDVAPNMNWDIYLELKKVFHRNGIRPVIGVIPDNRDPILTGFPACSFDFWRDIRMLQSNGWSVAMHGYQHRLTMASGGLLKLHQRSEFSGLPLEAQVDKLRAGKAILEKNGLRIDAFMAPAHSFDENTIAALKIVSIRVLTDGFALFPFWKNDILWVPQLTEKPRRFIAGLQTFCLHPNSMNLDDVESVRRFIGRNASNCVPFSAAATFTSNTKWNVWCGITAIKILRGIRSARRLIRSPTHKE